MRGWMPITLMLWLVAGGQAAAQTKPPGLPGEAAPPTLERRACAEHNLPGQGDTHETQGRAAPDSLGDRLAQSGGVICPPEGLDPDIRAPAPNGGRTPVIPPLPRGEAPAEPK